MNWKRALWGVLFATPAIALLAYGLTRDPRDIPSPLPGTDAPGFALEVLGTEAEARARAAGVAARDPLPAEWAALPPARRPIGARMGDTVRLADHRGEVVVLNFWASWCLACRSEHAELSMAATRYAAGPVRFFGALYNDSPENGRRWIMEMGGQAYPGLLDPDSRTAIDYGLYGVPETFIIGPDGKVAYKHVGPVTQALLVEKIDAILAAHAGTQARGEGEGAGDEGEGGASS